MTDPKEIRWTCPTCNVLVVTPFCARCGEQPLAPRELTLHGLAENFWRAFTSLDARTARTAWCLLRHPGKLTVAWTQGVHKPYVAPFQLFLIANVLFFAIQSLTGENVFSSTLDSHLHHQDWSDLARSLVTQRLQDTNTRLEDYAPAFDRAVVLHAKSLILLMTIPFALLLPLVFFRKQRPFMAHVVFSLHLYTFLLLLFCAALLAARFSAFLGIGGLETPMVDNVLSVANVLACMLYLYVAIGPVYGSEDAIRVLQTILLSISIASIVLGYRFVLFLITVSTI